MERDSGEGGGRGCVERGESWSCRNEYPKHGIATTIKPQHINEITVYQRDNFTSQSIQTILIPDALSTNQIRRKRPHPFHILLKPSRVHTGKCTKKSFNPERPNQWTRKSLRLGKIRTGVENAQTLCASNYTFTKDKF